MKNIYKALCFVLLAAVFAGCPKDDSPAPTPPIPYADQKPIDEAAIDNFLETHYVTVDVNYNTTFTKIEEGGTETPISQMPNLESITVHRNDLDYTLKYLKLREGIGEQPIKVDSAFVSYKGSLLSDTVFDLADSPVWFKLDEVVPGWGEIMSKFKTGTFTAYPDGSVIYSDYGAGVMFLPSAFAYYNLPIGDIPAYSPLIFNFKLYDQFHRDHDNDKVKTMFEYDYQDPAFPDDPSKRLIYDTDGDGTPDYLDLDDDNDGVLTIEEVRSSAIGVLPVTYYDFNDIPTCIGGTKKRHVDSTCH